ncbi:tyrosine-type recombinase/integrase [Telmatocola sphagniphila]|uniref:Tyrosine-type recombinase/integrase n=1 Tax=Telmatocola sphagniphila TaxID=1123043 RepID=A0A8E6B1U6_9BACT|nr:tyrosine-type recombinase/integrase [Telmatocola sphagniphila]QVL30252.1 tyrosine-type recombinase/integrase [Telmatocola sphagniphila]
MSNEFRIGKVRGYRRGKIWYLCYNEQGRRHRPRVGPDRNAARQLASQINSQLDVGAPAALSFESITIEKARQQWLEHHEQVSRSSINTIHRYRTATDHLLRFLDLKPVRTIAQFTPSHAAEFVAYLRSIRVSPNGHERTIKRPLLDGGLIYVLETCRTLFSYAKKRRYLSPYAENPFQVLNIDRIPIEEFRPIELFKPEEERVFLQQCDEWQFPIFLTLMLTGMRPGEMCHLLVPEDIDLEKGSLRIRNKPRLGWQIKTRNERDIPLVPELVEVLKLHVSRYPSGPLFRRSTWNSGPRNLVTASQAMIERELNLRMVREELRAKRALERIEKLRIARALWNEMGALQEDRLRIEFTHVTQAIGLSHQSAPKVLRHMFATTLQEGRVDPIIRNLLMGHSISSDRNSSHGLGMTAVYTHTQAGTIREQLTEAMQRREAIKVAREWLRIQATN